MTKEIRYTYAWRKTYESALDCVEDCYATGEISECENVDVVKRGNRYAITLRDTMAEHYLSR